jgi:acetyl esterase/lipase
MPLHPQAQAMIEAFGTGPLLDYMTLTGAEFRAAFDVPSPAVVGPELARIEDRTISGVAGPIRVRLYYPKGEEPLPITLYVHGGGFVIGSPETTDGICRTLAAGANSLVISPDYRLAPEAPFPAGLNDCWAALAWAYYHAGEIGGDAARMAVAGDSSGGNFAAVIAQMSRDRGPLLRHQLLLYPVLDHNFETSSHRDFEQGYFLTGEMIRWFWRQYLPGDQIADDWRASPLRQTSLENLPPATIFTAEYDVLRDEAELYASRLIGAGIPTAVKRWAGQIHGFLLQQGTIDDADLALREAAGALRAAFA